jgi:hypothetical protein
MGGRSGQDKWKIEEIKQSKIADRASEGRAGENKVGG